MAAIGTGWVDGAWIQAAWETGAWSDVIAPIVDEVTFFGPDEHDLIEDDQAILAIIKSYIQRVA